MASTYSSRHRPRARSSYSLARFFQWWGRELAAWVPVAWWPPKRPSGRMVWFDVAADALRVQRAKGRTLELVGQISLADGDEADRKIAFDALIAKASGAPAGLVLPADQVLYKDIELPLAARENLAQVVGFELGRHTPFTADLAYVDFRTLREDLGTQHLTVRIGVVPRGAVDGPLAQLAAYGITPVYAAVKDEIESGGHCFDFLPPHLRPKRSVARLWLYAAMAALTLALFAALLAIPLWQKREVVIALQPIELEARRAAAHVAELRQEQERLAGEYNFPIERKFVTPARLALIEEVTRLLPDDTWLQELDIHGNEITMQGNTRSSAKLIGLFESSRLMADAHFKAPLVKVLGNEERFQLAAAIPPINLARALDAQRKLLEKQAVPHKPAVVRKKRSTKS